MNRGTQLQRHAEPSIASLFNTTGKRIRMLRVGYGLTQLELSQALKGRGVDVNNTFISQIENSGAAQGGDSKRPSLAMLAAIAQELDTTTDFLLMLTDDPSVPQPPAVQP